MPSTDPQLVESSTGEAAGQPEGGWSGEDWSGHGWVDEGLPWDETSMDGASENDWFENVFTSDWSWDDWVWDDGSVDASSDALAAEADALATETDALAAEAPTADAPESGDSVSATALLAETTTLATDVLAAPTMSVSGTTVSWRPISGVSSYVFVRKVPGQTTQYSIVNGTSVMPPVVAGQTVSYGVRTNVSGSNWANEVTITYPATSTPPATGGAFQTGITAGASLSYELSFLRGLGAHTARLDYGISTSA
ncbi:MAG: hypothetical protein ACJ76L_09785, partial [Conexibacter sp.]